MNKTFSISLCISTALTTIMIPGIGLGQVDPGVRGGPAGAGAPVSPIQVNELAMFTEGKFRVTEVEATCDGCSQVTPGGSTGEDPFLQTKTNSAGLRAPINTGQFISCHSQPALRRAGGVP